MLTPRILLACAVILITAAAPKKAASTQVITLQPRPGTAMDTTARTLVADDLAAARTRGDKPLVLIATANLGGERQALLVQLQSAQECGSAGCTTSIYMWEHGSWKRVLDGTTGRLTVSATKTKGRPDLVTDDDHFVWTGTAYRSIHPAPAIDLIPRMPKR